MAEKSLSDVESDSEFEEVLTTADRRQRAVFNDFLWTERFWTGISYVQGLASKNQFDRLQRLVDVLAQRGTCPPGLLKFLLRQVLWTAVIKRQRKAVRCVFRHLRARRSDFSVRWITETEEVAVILAIAVGRRRTFDVLQDVTFAFNYRGMDEHFRRSLRCPFAWLFKASLLGDLDLVKRILSADNSGSYTQRHGPFKSDPVLDISAWGATARGHVDVLKELLSYQRKFCSLLTRKKLLMNVVALASLTKKIPLAAEVINHGAPTADVPEAFRVIFATIGDDPAALDDTFFYARRSFGDTVHHLNLRSRTVIDKRDPFFIAFSTAVQFRNRRQVGALLEMLSHDESLWRVSNGLPCSVGAVLRARSLPILRKMLVDSPHPFIYEDECTYGIVCANKWFAGARLLLGAGVLCPSGEKHIPAEYAKEFKPSLEEMCQKVIRINLKRPLSQSVEKLPLPGVVKRGLLFK